MKRPLYSVYPDANQHIRPMFHGIIYPRVCKFMKRFYVMWTRDEALDITAGFTPNHFVPLMKTGPGEKKKRLKTDTKIVNPITIEDVVDDAYRISWKKEDDDLVELLTSLVCTWSFSVQYF